MMLVMVVMLGVVMIMLLISKMVVVVVMMLVIFLHFLSCLACCVHTATKRERIGRNLLLCSLHTKETQKEKSSYHHHLKRLQPLIVHPGFGDLQKWILQVKYSLVAKDWVSDSKILKRRQKDP